jgi:hypothetical protein
MQNVLNYNLIKINKIINPYDRIKQKVEINDLIY